MQPIEIAQLNGASSASYGRFQSKFPVFSLLPGNSLCGDRFRGTASSATHSWNPETSSQPAQRPAFRGPLRARRLETGRNAYPEAHLAARSLTSDFESPDFAHRLHATTVCVSRRLIRRSSLRESNASEDENGEIDG
jgi:hypothetical protein